MVRNQRINPQQLLQHFDRISEAPDAIPRLRRFILDLAVRGKLVEQDPNDEPANELLRQIQVDRGHMVNEGLLRPEKPYLKLDDEAMEFNAPKNWKWVRLGQIIKLWNGYAFKSGDFQATGIPVIRIGDLQNGEVNIETATRVSEAVANQVASEVWVPQDALLIAMSGATTGKVAFNRTGIRLLLNQRVGRIQVFRLNISFLKYFFETIIAQNLSISFGTAIPNLSTQQINETPFPLPPLVEQDRIVAKVDELMTLCDQLQAAQTEREQSRDRLVAASLNKLNQSEQSRRPGMDCRDPDFRDESNAKPTTPAAILAKQPAEIAEAPPAYLPVNWVPAPVRARKRIPAGTTGFDDVRFVLENLPRLTTRPAHIKQLRQTILNLAVRGKLVLQDQDDKDVRIALMAAFEVKRNLAKASKLPKKALPVAPYLSSNPFALPKNWGFVNFDHLAAPILNALKAGPFGSALKKDCYVPQGFKVYGQEQVIGQDAEIGDYYISEAKFNELKSCAVAPSDLLISLVGTIGKVLVLPSDCRPGIINPRLIKLSLNFDLVNPKYVELLLASPWVREFLFSEARGATMDVLNLTILRSLPIPLPPLAEQHRIVAKVDELMALCDQLETQLTNTAADSRRLLEAVLHEVLLPATEQAA